MNNEKYERIFEIEPILEDLINSINQSFLNISIEIDRDYTYIGPRLSEKVSINILNFLILNFPEKFNGAYLQYLIGLNRHFINQADRLATSVSNAIADEKILTGNGGKVDLTSGGDEEVY